VKLPHGLVADWDKSSATGSDRPVHEALEIMTAPLDVTDLHKQFSIGRPAIDGVSFACAAERLSSCWGLRVRQDHDVALRCGVGAPDIRRNQHRRPRGIVARTRSVPPRSRDLAWCFSLTRSGRT